MRHKYEFNRIHQRTNILVADALKFISTLPVIHDQIHVARGRYLARKPRAASAHEPLQQQPELKLFVQS